MHKPSLSPRIFSKLTFPLLVAATLLVSGWTAGAVLARETAPVMDPNPLLQKPKPDPLVPRLPVDRPLSPLELRSLRQALDELDARAQQQLLTGDTEGAFEIWMRSLRLRQLLGTQEELQALTRIGGIAWRENRSVEVRWISERLSLIRRSLAADNAEVDSQTLQSLAIAYEQVRSPSALEVYEQLLARARTQGNEASEVSLLGTLGRLYLSYLEYERAAVAYEQLLGFVQRGVASPDPLLTQEIILQKLIYSYSQIQRYALAIDKRQQLIEFYQGVDNTAALPGLKLAQARDYQSLGDLTVAAQQYQEAFTLAWTLQRFSEAGDALAELAVLHSSQGRYQTALEIYNILLEVRERARDSYGAMVAYNRMGIIFLELKAYPQALQAFESGLEMARRIGDREEYFRDRIRQVRGLAAGSPNLPRIQTPQAP